MSLSAPRDDIELERPQTGHVKGAFPSKWSATRRCFRFDTCPVVNFACLEISIVKEGFEHFARQDGGSNKKIHDHVEPPVQRQPS